MLDGMILVDEAVWEIADKDKNANAYGKVSKEIAIIVI